MPRYARRLLALLLLFTVLGVLGSVTVLPVLTRSAEYDESIADLGFRLQRLLRLADQEAQLQNQLSQLSARQQREGLLQGESDAIAAANLQAMFKQRVQEAGGRLESTQILPGETGGAVERIALRAQFSGDIEALQRVLHGIEYGTTMLFVDKIELRQKRVRRRPRQPDQSIASLLQVSLEISGYRQGEVQQ